MALNISEKGNYFPHGNILFFHKITKIDQQKILRIMSKCEI